MKMSGNLNSVSILLGFLALACVFGKAGGVTNETSSALSLPASADEKISDAGAGPRDPFWPVGFVPSSTAGLPAAADKLADGKVADPAVQMGEYSAILRLGGVVKKNGKFYATINGFTVQTGEVVTAVSGGEVFKFVVETIDFNKIKVKSLKQ